jgi:AraC-like DNA-binding protein
MVPNGARVLPLQRFSFSSADEDELTDFIRQMYVGNKSRFLRVDPNARFAAGGTTVGDLTATQIRCTVDFACATDAFDYFLALAVTNGRLRYRHGRSETVVSPGEASFYPLGVPLDVELTDLGVRTLRLPTARLEQAAAEIAGVSAQAFRFEATTPISPAMHRYWLATMQLVLGALTTEPSPMAYPLMAEEMTRLAAIAALHVFPNTTMTRPYAPGPERVPPAVLRRAIAYIDEHAAEPLTLSDIAAAAGTSGRALQYAFRRHYEVTPLGYVRRVRLERAHQELRAGDPRTGVTVADVAARWGFVKASSFARSYRRAFGVLPSQTLRS